jgi:hypothetical protein
MRHAYGNANGDGHIHSHGDCDGNGNGNGNGYRYLNADTDGDGYIHANANRNSNGYRDGNSNANTELSTYNLDRVKLQWHTHQRWQLHLVQWRAEAERPRCGPGNDSFHPADNYQRKLHAFRAGCECDV